MNIYSKCFALDGRLLQNKCEKFLENYLTKERVCGIIGI